MYGTSQKLKEKCGYYLLLLCFMHTIGQSCCLGHKRDQIPCHRKNKNKLRTLKQINRPIFLAGVGNAANFKTINHEYPYEYLS